MKKLAPVALVVISALSITACTSTQQRTVGGAAVGGLAGAAVGGALGGGTGAVVGAAAGGATGAIVGSNMR